MRPSGSAEALERRRLQAIALFQDGFQPVEIAKKLSVGRRSVRLWKAQFLAGGTEAIRARPTPGRPWKLDRAARTALETLLLRGARASGYATDLWTCPRVTQIIARRFGVHYHVDHIGRFLRSLGWSPQKPQRRALERDDEAIRRWVKTTWPKVKKTPRG
jgi:transposase